MRHIKWLVAGVIGGHVLMAWAIDKPNLSLANTYQANGTTITLTDYMMSEKYDGARALWDGKQFVSRGGKVYQAPAWFTKGLPSTVLDGELWLSRGQFEKTMSIIRQQKAHQGWQVIHYWVFDLPNHKGTFQQRYRQLLKLKANNINPYWQVVKQSPIRSMQSLQTFYNQVLNKGGEGVMLRRIQSKHRGGRSNDLLKYKPFTDDEAVVIGYRQGKGKYQGKVGSLQVRTAKGIEFYVGSGLSNAMRQIPPPLGTVITYKYQGITAKGKPRFPVFLRIRSDEPH